MTKKILSNKSDYAQKLKDPRWQQLRLKVLERDGWACVKCSDTESTLHVHHTYYADPEDEMDPWVYGQASLITLCDECHKSEHENLPSARAALTRAVSSAGLGSVCNLLTIADGFEFDGGFMSQKDASVLAFAIQTLLASKYVFENGSANKKRIEEGFHCLARPEIWSNMEDVYFKTVTPRQREMAEKSKSEGIQ
jgi:hypothetical protein